MMWRQFPPNLKKNPPNLDVKGGCNNQFVGLKVGSLSNKKLLYNLTAGCCFDLSLLRFMTGWDFRDRVAKAWCRSR
jgi:hypothetical protein